MHFRQKKVQDRRSEVQDGVVCKNFGKHLAVFKQMLIVQSDVLTEGLKKKQDRTKILENQNT